jgi:hypothetical protein
MRAIVVLAAVLMPSMAVAAGFPVSGTYGTDAGCTLFERFGVGGLWTGGVEHDVKGLALLLQPDRLSGELLICPVEDASFRAGHATMKCIFGDEGDVSAVAMFHAEFSRNAKADTVAYADDHGIKAILHRCKERSPPSEIWPSFDIAGMDRDHGLLFQVLRLAQL